MEITEKEYLNIAVKLTAAVFSNPSSGGVVNDSYYRQVLIAGILKDVMFVLQNNGFNVVQSHQYPENEQ